MSNARSRLRLQWDHVQPDLIRSAIIAGAVLVLLAPWLLDGDLAIVSPTDLGTDLVTKQWPNAAYILQAWRQGGDVPLWRTTALGGVPIVGNPSMLLVYPVYWLVFLFPIGWAFTFYFALHLAWAGWGVYGLARRTLELSSGAALLAALAFALSAKLVAHMGGGHLDIVAAAAWLPWLWWAVDEMARRPSRLSVAGVAAAAAAQALTHLPTLWLGAMVMGCWWLSVRLADRSLGASRRWLASGIAVLAAVALAMALCAAQLLPMLELLPLSTRGTMSLGAASRYALPVPLMIGLVFPPALAFPEWVVYVGAAALALAPASWLVRNSVRSWRFCIAVVVLGTIFSLGSATPLYPLLLRLLPGMNWLRVPTRIMFPVQLACALLAGMGWDALKLARPQRLPRLTGWWIVLALLTVIGAAWTHWFPGVWMVSDGEVIVVVALVAALVIHFRVQRIQPYTPAILSVLVALEAFVLSPRFIAQGRVSMLAARTPEVDFLTSQQATFRVYSPRGLVSFAQAVTHHLETVDGNDPFQLNHYVRWLNTAAGCERGDYTVSVPTCTSNEVDATAYLRARPNEALLGVGNVRYVVADHPLSQWPSEVWQSGPVRIYENPAWLPRAFVASAIVVEADDAAALALLRERGPQVAVIPRATEAALFADAMYRPGQVIRRTGNSIEVQADGPGWLVLSEVWTPGWQALVDGVKSPVYRTDVAFCGLPLSSGPHIVMFTYAPTAWTWGWRVSLAGVIGWVIMLLSSLPQVRSCSSH